MKITKIVIQRFKALKYIEFSPTDLNVLIGGNNAGKSSFLHAIQFAVAVVQGVYSVLKNKVHFNKDSVSTTLSYEELEYSPAKQVLTLAYGNEELAQAADKQIEIEFLAEDNDGVPCNAKVCVRRGKNKNLAVTIFGEKLCNIIGNKTNTFCMYVPGLAGVPFNEEYKADGTVRRAVTKGDANTILRNVILRLFDNKERWELFLEDICILFPYTKIDVNGHLNEDGIIEVNVTQNGIRKSLETIGTGLLQAIQISAYIHYFSPQILLLDEPDSHLHPNNQQVLCEIIKNSANSDRRIIIATHSRHLLGAIKKYAQVVVLVNGQIKDFEDDHEILFELGALDQFDIIKNPRIKYIVATEDTSPESNKMLSLILQSSGFKEDSFSIVPYGGSSKVDSVIYLSKCMYKFRSDLLIIVHRDRDGMYQEEIDEYIQRVSKEPNVRCFITDGNDLEGYYCNPEHITEILRRNNKDANFDKIRLLCEEALGEIEAKTKEIYLNRKLDHIQGAGKEAIKAIEFYEKNKLICTNGHVLIGAISSHLHQDFHIRKNELLVLTPHISASMLCTIINDEDEVSSEAM